MIYAKLFELKKKDIAIKRDTKAFNYKYATLDQIQEQLGQYLEELNLVVIHRTEDEKVITEIFDIEDSSSVKSVISIWTITTIKEFVDKSGASIRETTSQDPQAVGSIITYYRRYNLLQLLDLKTEDDDGAKASPRAQSNMAKLKPYEDFVTELKNSKTYDELTKVYASAVAVHPNKKQDLVEVCKSTWLNK